MRTILRSIWIWSASLSLILLWTPWMWVRKLTDRDPVKYKTGWWFRRLGKSLVQVNPAWDVHLEGEEINDPRRPYVVVCNHQSMVDIPIICYMPWEMKWVAKASLWKTPLVGRMLKHAGDIPVVRSDRRSGVEAMIKAKDYLQQKCSVFFFPEGTRTRDGKIKAFKDGAFRLAIKAGVPILPFAIEGTRHCLPRNSWKFGEPQTIFLEALKPIETTGLTVKDVPMLREKVRQVIMEALARRRNVEVEAVDGNLPVES